MLHPRWTQVDTSKQVQPGTKCLTGGEQTGRRERQVYLWYHGTLGVICKGNWLKGTE